MGKITKKKVNICDLCCGNISKSSNSTSTTNFRNSANLLWNYLYHQNVKEALLPATNEENDEDYRIPKLTFSLSLGKTIKADNGNSIFEICDECTVELETLDKLHQQLESVKKLINSQIDKIKAERINNEAGQSTKQSSRRKSSSRTQIQPPAGINFGGCSIGKENISQTLTFLSTICEGISSSPPPLPLIEPNPTRKVSKTIIKTDNPDNLFNWVTDTATNDLGVSLSTDSTEDIDRQLHIEVGEEFVSIVKIDPDAPQQEEDLKLPEKDPLEIPVPTKPKIKYPKRPEYSGKGPRFLPCKLCNTKVFKWNWETHQKWHKREKQWKCDKCQGGFTTRGSLLRHLRWHDNPYECNKCGKGFYQKYKCDGHQNNCRAQPPEAINADVGDIYNDVEVPEKDPLEIPVVPENPKRKSKKRPDFPGKIGSKSLPCQLCKTMVFGWNWEIHQKWHAGEKQFECELCNAGFTTRRSMYRHKRMKHKLS